LLRISLTGSLAASSSATPLSLSALLLLVMLLLLLELGGLVVGRFYRAELVSPLLVRVSCPTPSLGLIGTSEHRYH
jgi:hypothetical protein